MRVMLVGRPPPSHSPEVFCSSAHDSCPPVQSCGAGHLRTSAIGLLVTAVGSILALAALSSLKWNFSIIPEVRLLVVSGPYRWLRHPMYFAELLMIVGLALGSLRIVYLVGAVCSWSSDLSNPSRRTTPVVDLS